MKIKKIAVARSLDALTWLHGQTMSADEVPNWDVLGRAWVALSDTGTLAGFLYCEPQPGCWYFSRVGVLPAFRGQGLQRKLMRRMQRSLKTETIISTTYQNPSSANNFVREQWMTYCPRSPWGASDTIYWYKDPVC
jgi:ribosomal protein S18 acetylase RimI-like enzyme